MSDIDGAVRRLREASDSGVPTEPIHDLLDTLDDAYAVQASIMAERESITNPLVGHKVGLTSVAVQKQLGVSQPDFGVLLADMHITDGVIDMSRLIQPKVEAEIAFILGSDVEDLDRESVLAAVASVAPALEIVDSRIADWRIGLFDTVADNASSGMYVLGAERYSPDDVDLVAAEMTMTCDGRTISTGRGADCLGDPVNALVWVAEVAASQGRPLRAGEVVLSGALGPMVALEPGTVVHASIGGVGTVTATVGKQL